MINVTGVSQHTRSKKLLGAVVMALFMFLLVGMQSGGIVNASAKEKTAKQRIAALEKQVKGMHALERQVEKLTAKVNRVQGLGGELPDEPMFNITKLNVQPIGGNPPARGLAVSECPTGTTAITGWGSTDGIMSSPSNATQLNRMMVDSQFPNLFQVEAWAMRPLSTTDTVKSVAVCVNSSLVKWL